MTAKLTASADGTKATFAVGAEDALQIDSTTKTISAVAPYQIASSEVVLFRAKRTTDQALTANVFTVVLFNTEEIDTHNWYEPSTGRFTPQIAGWYQVILNVGYSASNYTTQGCIIKKNDTVAEALSYHFYPNLTSGGSGMNLSALVHFNGTTDFIDARVLITGTAPTITANNSNFFSAHLVRAD
jgi:hypothetical protein